MSDKLFQGKLPISEKPVETKTKLGPSFEDDDILGNRLKLPENFVATLKSYGFDVRFINNKKLIEDGGYHKRGWKPFKSQDFSEISEELKVNQFLYGKNPDGTILRGDALLAVRPLTMSERHREVIDERTRRQSKVVTNTAEKLRETARKHNLNSVIKEGYDD